MFMRKVLLAGAMVAALATAGSAAAATNLITNGGFEASANTPAFPFATVSGVNAIPGWNVGPGTVDWINTYWDSSDDDGYSIDLNGLSPGTISQTITTIPLKSYTLTFDMSGNPDMFRGQTRVAVVGANGAIGTALYDISAANSRTNMLWETKSFGFVANSTTTVISFTSGNLVVEGNNNCCWGAAIDNVAVAVPEPATWALMIGGFAGAGAMIRRRRASGVAA